MNATSPVSTRALVLGGGGSTGNAWLIGVVAGLAEGGLDVTEADLVIGTSAGSTAAAMITAADPSTLYSRILSEVVPARPAAGLSDPQRVRMASEGMERTARIISGAADLVDMRRRMGAAALENHRASDGSWPAQWRATAASRLPKEEWPDQLLRITAVDAETGDPVVFDKYSGVDLADAVAASTSGGALPHRIDDRLFIDGGYRTNAENADLASGYSRVLVLSPFGGRTRLPLEWGADLATQVAQLRQQRSTVETIFPDAESERMFGVNGMDLSLRPGAAKAGHAQGVALADGLREFWVTR